MSQSSTCSHIQQLIEVALSDTNVCEECIKTNSEWVHLRVCQTCGVTLCCDDSPSQHMTKHFHATGHPVIASAEPGERWLWCNADKVFVEY